MDPNQQYYPNQQQGGYPQPGFVQPQVIVNQPQSQIIQAVNFGESPVQVGFRSKWASS